MDIDTPDFHEYIARFTQKTEAVSMALINEYKQKYSIIDTLYSAGPTAPYLVNLTNMRYPFMCNSIENILGIPASDFETKGVELLFNNIHPDDLKIMQAGIIPSFMALRKTMSLEDTKRLRYTYNYRFNHSTKGFINIMEQVIPLELDDQGAALLMFGIISDMSAYMQDKSMVATVSKLNKKDEYKTILHKDFLQDKPNILTKREMDIVRLLAKGMTSRDIAEKLFISETTVSKHRQNMLSKTGKKNTQELVFLLLEQGWL